MNQINPKLDFQTFMPNYAEEIRRQAPQPWFRHACNVALAQLAHQGASAEELSGARRFLGILSNLGEMTPEPIRLPVKTLDEPEEIAAKLADK